MAIGVSNQPPDTEHLEPMLQRIAASTSALPDVMTLDAGYWSEGNADLCADQGMDAYIATGRLPHAEVIQSLSKGCGSDGAAPSPAEHELMLSISPVSPETKMQ